MKKSKPVFNIKRLRELKLKLNNESELSDIWEFYMDYFSDHQEFINLGQLTQHPVLEKIVPTITKNICNQPPRNLFLIAIPEYEFVHGGFFVGSRPSGLIYFEENFKGMLAISGVEPSNIVKYSRFTGKMLNN